MSRTSIAIRSSTSPPDGVISLPLRLLTLSWRLLAMGVLYGRGLLHRLIGTWIEAYPTPGHRLGQRCPRHPGQSKFLFTIRVQNGSRSVPVAQFHLSGSIRPVKRHPQPAERAFRRSAVPNRGIFPYRKMSPPPEEEGA